MSNIHQTGLEHNAANHRLLSPLRCYLENAPAAADAFAGGSGGENIPSIGIEDVLRDEADAL